jgi:hypothetical protein
MTESHNHRTEAVRHLQGVADDPALTSAERIALAGALALVSVAAALDSLRDSVTTTAARCAACPGTFFVHGPFARIPAHITGGQGAGAETPISSLCAGSDQPGRPLD